MSDFIYHIRIKKEYASSLLEDLQQTDAIEIIENDISEWQKKESLARLAEMKADPDSTISEEDFFNALANDDE